MTIIGALWNYIGGLGKERGKYEKPFKTTFCFSLVQQELLFPATSDQILEDF